MFDDMHFITLETEWQLVNDRRRRLLADATRRRRFRPHTPADHIPDPPDRAA